MTIPVQDSLPSMPPIPGRVDDLEEWFKVIWPAYVDACDTGRPFTISKVAADNQLPDPPKSQSQWGLVPGRLVKAGIAKAHTNTGKSSRPGVHNSLVHQWIGIPTDERAEAAA